MRKGKGTVRRVLAVNLFITLLLVGVMIGNSLFLLNTVKRNSADVTKRALKSLAGTLEDEYFRLNRLMILCNDDPDLILALTNSIEKTEVQSYLSNAQEKISMIQASMPYADNVYAYNAGNNTVITTDKGIMNAEEFWKKYGGEEIRDLCMGTFHVLTATTEGLYVICPIQKYGSIVIDIDTQAFSDMLVARELNHDIGVLVYDNAGNILLRDTVFSERENWKLQEQEDGKIIVGENSYYKYSTEIPSIGYSCVLLNSVNIVEDNLRSVNMICILALILEGLFSSTLFLYNNKVYRPVQKLISEYGSKNGTENEIDYITSRLEELTRKEENQLAWGEQKQDLNVSLYYLFYNEIDGNLNSRINQLYNGASLALVAFQDMDGEPDRQLTSALEKNWGGVLAVPCDAYMTAFVLPGTVERKEFLEFLTSLIEPRREGKAFVTFSTTFTEKYSIKDAFNDSVKQMEATAIESSKLLTVSDEQNYKNGVRYIKLGIQQQIVNSVIQSNMSLVEEIFALLLNGGSSLAEYRSICKTIASLLDYMVNTWSLEFTIEKAALVNYDKMYHPGYMTNSLLEYFREIMQAYQKGSNSSLRDAVLEYLHENYTKTLSLELIAEKFHITPTYLSGYFKKEVGENISSYLANLRIAEAKRLLETTDLKVSDISEQVGIYSQTTFIRLFKKNCGMTPNEYRKAQEKE